MSLERRLFLAIGCVTLLLIVSVALIADHTFMANARHIEERQATENLRRAFNAIRREIVSLDRLAGDWAHWDDAYEFIERPDELFVAANLLPSTFSQLQLNVVAFVHTSGHVVYGASCDLRSARLEPLPASFREMLVPGARLLDHARAEDSVSGVLPLREGMLLFAARPVLPSNQSGTIRGTLVMGRFLDARLIAHMADTAELSVEVRPWRDAQRHFGFAAGSNSHDPRHGPVVHLDRSDQNTIDAYGVVDDLHGQPAIVLRVRTLREVYWQAWESVRILTAALLLTAAVLTGLAVLLVKKYVTHPLGQAAEHLREGLGHVAAAGTLAARIPETGTLELVRLTRAVNDMLAKLEATQAENEHQRQALIRAERLVALGTLVSGVAHEINNPNAVINLGAGAVADLIDATMTVTEQKLGDTAPELRIAGRLWPDLRAEIQRILAGIVESTNRIGTIVAELKEFARADAPAKRVDVNDVLLGATALLRHRLEKATRHFTMSCTPNLPPVRGSRQRLEQVVVNLLQNAAEALRTPEERIELVVEHAPGEHAITLHVRDNGRGIDPKDLPHIQDPFFTTRRTAGGTGLGLSISATIVAEHGGTMRFESELGRGTCATVTLPIHDGGIDHA